MKILVVGSVAYDSIRTPKGRRDRQLGGSASYFSVAASYFAEVSVVAVVGQDFHPRDTRLLESRGIDLSTLERAQGNTFRWTGQYKDDLNAAITLDTQLNVFEDFRPSLNPAQARAPYLFLANIDPAHQHAVLDAMANTPRMVACDTMNLWIDTARPELERLFPKTDALLINEAEAKQLTGNSSFAEAAHKLLDSGIDSLVIKRGEHGAALFNRDFIFATPAIPLSNVIDPTGAGDSFAGGFMGYLAATNDQGPAALRTAVVAGSVMASFAVEAFGLERLADLSQDDIRERFDDFIRMTRFGPEEGASQLPLLNF